MRVRRGLEYRYMTALDVAWLLFKPRAGRKIQGRSRRTGLLLFPCPQPRPTVGYSPDSGNEPDREAKRISESSRGGGMSNAILLEPGSAYFFTDA